jgi:hypothetical protein
MQHIIDEGKIQLNIYLILLVFFFKSRFEVRLPDIFQHIHQAWSAIDGRLRAEQFKVFEIKFNKNF